MEEASYQQLISFSNLRKASFRARKGTKPTSSVAIFFADLEQNILQLQSELAMRHYTPKPFVSFSIQDPKPRDIQAAAFRDRVVHHALCAILEPIFENVYVENSFACRKGKGNHQAIKQVQSICRNYPYFVKLDIRHCFETLSHSFLQEKLRNLISDVDVLWLLHKIIAHGKASEGRGVPIGNLSSQHFANFYLHHIDVQALHTIKVKNWVRYMDDMLFWCSSKAQAWSQFRLLQDYIESSCQLEIKMSTVLIAPTAIGVPFLGFRIWSNQIRLDGSRKRRMHRKLKQLSQSSNIAAIRSVHSWLDQGNTYNLRRAFYQQTNHRLNGKAH